MIYCISPESTPLFRLSEFICFGVYTTTVECVGFHCTHEFYSVVYVRRMYRVTGVLLKYAVYSNCSVYLKMEHTLSVD